MRVSGLAIGAVLAFAGVSMAAAEQVPVIPANGVVAVDNFYWSLGSQVQYLQLARFNSNFTRGDGTAFQSLKPTVVGFGATATVGYVFDWPFGMRPRIEGGFAHLAGRSSHRDSFTEGGLATATFLNGNALNGTWVPANWTVNLDTKINTYDGVLRFKTDFALGPKLTLTPSVGAVFGGTNLVLHETLQQSAPPSSFPKFIHEKLNVFRAGGEVGLDGTFQMNQAFSLQGGIRGTIYSQRSHLMTNECYGTNVSPGECNNKAFIQGQVRDTDVHIGGRLAASLGGTYSWGWAQLTLLGTAAYTFNNPGVQNPNGAAFGPAVGQARIRYDNTWSFGGMVAVTFPLN